MLDPRPSSERHLFRTGERVAFSDGTGVIIAAFPDGFHLIRLDGSGQVTGAHASQMKSVDNAPGESGDRSRRKRTSNDVESGSESTGPGRGGKHQ